MNIIKKLPKIYQNHIDKKINNNREMFCSFSLKEKNNINNEDIELLLDGLFNGKRNVYNIPVIIKTIKKTYDTFLVARNSSYILTIDQEKIPINDIVSIKRKNP